MLWKTFNPHNGELLSEYQGLSWEEVEEKINLAEKSFQKWKVIDQSQKKDLILNLKEKLNSEKEILAKIITDEMGKPFHQSLSEIEKCTSLCEYYTENFQSQLLIQEIKTEAEKSYVSFEPLGVVFGIMPWNFPFWQVLRFAIPTLLAGNTVLLKHSPNVAGCSAAIEFLFKEFPEGTYQNLFIHPDQVVSFSEKIIAHPPVQGVSLTGSIQAGKAIGKIAGENLKKTVLELGGNDPYLILEDANLDHAAKLCAASRLINSGQTCIAAKRILVVEKIYDEFLEKFKAELLKIEIGPLARKDLQEKLHHQVQESLKTGAKLEFGGELSESKGFHYQKTLLTNVFPGQPAFDDELFGPVACVTKVKNENEAIQLANQSEFGLGAAVFTKDFEKGNDIAKNKLNAGSCFVNDFVKSDPRLPFGGIKNSGLGRELSSFGIHEFTNMKTIVVNR